MTSGPSSSGPFGLSRFVFWGTGFLILLVASFAVGFAVGTRPINSLTQRMEQAQATAGETEARATALEARLHASEALSLLYRTLLDVDARNFGMANQRLDAATAALGRVNRQALGADAAELDAILRELTELHVRVAADPTGQRATLSGLAQRLAEALGV